MKLDPRKRVLAASSLRCIAARRPAKLNYRFRLSAATQRSRLLPLTVRVRRHRRAACGPNSWQRRPELGEPCPKLRKGRCTTLGILGHPPVTEPLEHSDVGATSRSGAPPHRFSTDERILRGEQYQSGPGRSVIETLAPVGEHRLLGRAIEREHASAHRLVEGGRYLGRARLAHSERLVLFGARVDRCRQDLGDRLLACPRLLPDLCQVVPHIVWVKCACAVCGPGSDKFGPLDSYAQGENTSPVVTDEIDRPFDSGECIGEPVAILIRSGTETIGNRRTVAWRGEGNDVGSPKIWNELIPDRSVLRMAMNKDGWHRVLRWV